jgi:dTDP-4-dehydrorhamnose 3,5-epimerase
MRIEPTNIPGVHVIEPEPASDERGAFARAFCRETFEQAGLNPEIVQCNVSYNKRAGTLRGMHYQRAPHGETKVVRVTRGAIYDVAVDLRAESDTYCQWHAERLTAENGRALYIPRGCAHGFQTLVDGTEVFYMMGAAYVPEAAAGVRWDDPALSIDWPLPVSAISDRDASYEALTC